MNIGKIDKQVLKMLNVGRIVRKTSSGYKDRKYMQETYYKFSAMTGQPLSVIKNLAQFATPDQFTFLKTLVNKFNHVKLNSMEDRSEHLLNVYSMVEKPTALHLNIVRKTKDSFESLEQIFSLAKDKEALQFVENLQYGELKNSDNASRIIIDLLSSKNRDRYIANPERYSSYIELHADKENAVNNLDNLINTGKYNKLRYDAQLAVKNLMKNKKMQVAMAGETHNLEMAYSEGKEGFLKKIVNTFFSDRKTPNSNTKDTVVDMYRTLNAENAKLRYDILDRFKFNRNTDKNAEIAEIKTLFDRIDKDEDAKKFVQKAINKDLRVASAAELNEILDIAPLKKANIFFNNAQRIIEQTGREERKTALIKELENPFFKPKHPVSQKAKTIRMYNPYEYRDGFFTKAAKFIENKINQYRYYRMTA